MFPKSKILKIKIIIENKNGKRSLKSNLSLFFCHLIYFRFNLII